MPRKSPEVPISSSVESSAKSAIDDDRGRDEFPHIDTRSQEVAIDRSTFGLPTNVYEQSAPINTSVTAFHIDRNCERCMCVCVPDTLVLVE
jgi:hypothetical protein